MKSAIFKSVVDTPIAHFLVAVESTAADAAGDIKLAASLIIKAHPAQLQLGEVKKSNRYLLRGLSPVYKAKSSTGQWAWMKRLD